MVTTGVRLGRIGGGLLIGGVASFVAMGVALAAGSSVGLGNAEVGSLALVAGIGLAGAGLAGIAIGGPAPFGGRGIRLGLAILAVGLLCGWTSSVIALASPYPLESWSAVVLFLVGGLAILLGLVVTVGALVLTAGRPRSLGLLFLAGLGLAIVGGALAASQGSPTPGTPVGMIATLVAGIGVLGIVGAVTGLGLLALAGETTPTAVGR